MVRTWNILVELLWPSTHVPNINQNPVTVSVYKNILYLFPYQEPDIKALIKQTKYQADRQTAKQLAGYLDSYLNTLETDFQIIPIPVSYKRWRTRGYNHIELICKYSQHAQQVRSDILKKSRHTTQQTQVTRIKRTQQQLGTYSCNRQACHTLPECVILLDDVTTTGATMAAAKAALLPHLPPQTKLRCVAIAH